MTLNQKLYNQLKHYIIDPKNIIEYGVTQLTNGGYCYRFTVSVGPVHDTKEYKFSYFRELTDEEIVKFIFRSLFEHESEYYIYNGKIKRNLILGAL